MVAASVFQCPVTVLRWNHTNIPLNAGLTMPAKPTRWPFVGCVVPTLRPTDGWTPTNTPGLVAVGVVLATTRTEVLPNGKYLKLKLPAGVANVLATLEYDLDPNGLI